MNSAFAFLILGLIIGTALGWLLRSSRAPHQDPQQLAALVSATMRAEGVDNAQRTGAQVTERVTASLAPLADAVGTLSQQVHQLDVDRAETFAHLSATVQAMSRTSSQLSDRTGKLVTALRAPQVRGRWGEMQLERVVELAGMVQHCDFDTQVTATGIRPDMIIRLSNGRNIVVDAKAPFVAYLDALDTEDPEEHEAHLRRHAHHLRTHVNQLAAKEYHQAFSPTPEFVVLFVPADPFLDAALKNDPELLEYSFSKNVLLTTPTTLIALLRTVALGWQHDALGEQAAQVQQLGSELYKRLSTLGEHMERLRGNLEKSVDSYNSVLGAMESRVFVTARKLDELNVLPTAHLSFPDTDYLSATPRTPRDLS
ncbi:DNA recombination protein RmuC [Staphylococcus chromogenes]|nr:DNA recombination protein RmuC [Staphylococcus chromogenes]